MTITIYYYDLWPTSMATRVLAEEVNGQGNLPAIVLAPVDMAKGEHRLPAFLKLNPTGLPPVVENDSGPDGHQSLVFEPLGAMAHISQAAGGSPIFYPPSPPCVFPLTYQWASFGQRFLAKPIEGLVREAKLRGGQPPNANRVQRLLGRLDRGLGILDKKLPAAGGFVNFDFLHQPGPTKGDFSVADIVIGAALTYTHRIPVAKLDLSKFPVVAAYLTALEARPSFTKVFAGVTIGAGVPAPDLA